MSTSAVLSAGMLSINKTLGITSNVSVHLDASTNVVLLSIILPTLNVLNSSYNPK